MLVNFFETNFAKRIPIKIGTSILIFATFFFAGSLIFAGAAYASQCGGVEIGCALKLGGQCVSGAFPTLGAFFTAVVRLGLFAAALIFFAMIVWGGFRFLNAGGERENVEGARKTLTGAGIGLVIVVSALIINQVVYQVFDLGQPSAAKPGTPYTCRTMKVADDLLDSLRGAMPIRTTNYYIDYSKQYNAFVVTIQKEPLKEHALEALDWFKDHGVKNHCDLNVSWTWTSEIARTANIQPSDFPLCTK